MTTPGCPIGTVDDFVSPADCTIIASALRAVGATSPYNQANRVELPARHLQLAEPAAYRIISALRPAICAFVGSFFDEADELFPEFTLLSEMRTGDRHVRHADNERRRGDSESWEPNHTPHRRYTGIAYLTRAGADFSGGTIAFPTIGESIAPRTGLLIAFRCDRRYEHEVSPVLSGSRISLSCWLTDSAQHAEPWPEPAR